MDQTLILHCWDDELNPAQMASYEKAKAEQAVIKEKLKELMVNQAGEELFIGEIFSAYQFQGRVQSIDDAYVVKAAPSPPKPVRQYKNQSQSKNTTSDSSPRGAKRKAALAAATVLLDDDDDVPLVKRATKRDRDYTPPTPKGRAPPATPPPSSSKKGKGSASAASKSSAKEKQVLSPFRPSEVSSIGGLTVGVNKDDGKKGGAGAGADQKEIAKLQGKTFPSLVVVAKPYLRAKEQTNVERSALDSKVKVVLMLTPAKFTEWLIQQGLLKSEQKCAIHRTNELKLGVYSDASKFPYSGGYVWISECCPTRFISVFHGSLFEGAPHPPSCILKLIYHWSCQTNIQNVVQWVKVDNLYIKGVYTWLRAICTLAINKHMKLMGGPGQYVEVGVISLGTTAQDGQQRQVKVEVLGVLDHKEKIVRLRAIEPFSEGDRSYKKRFAKILEPLTGWVSKDSIITIDLTVDKTTLQSMGYKHVLQVAANDTTAKHNNSTIMDYLRRIVPRMFQNTLSLLSRQMIQQFLDELVWREQFGTFPLQAFDNINSHLAEQTRIDAKDSLTQRLYQVATNPFKKWLHFELNSPTTLSTSRKSGGKKLSAKESSQMRSSEVIAKATKISSTPIQQQHSKKDTSTHSKKSPASASAPVASQKVEVKAFEETKGLEEIFYGILNEDENLTYNIEKNLKALDLPCSVCLETFKTNSSLQLNILNHINTEISREEYRYQCTYCLEKLPSERGLRRHEAIMHPSLTKPPNSVSYHCLICQIRFNTVQLLSTHLQRIHAPLELPYICNGCGYRTSSHHKIIEHFYKNHDNENMLQCPLCLAVYWIFSKDEILEDNIKRYILHMQQHLEKSNNKKCNKCVLSFITKGELKYHLSKDHLSFNGNAKVLKLTDSTINIPVPKAKHTPKPSSLYKTLEEYPQLILDIKGGKLCLECDRDLDEGIHISGFYKCQKCEYKTCCLRAVLEHASNCPSQANYPDGYAQMPLDKEMHCVCGFSSSEGNSMARHLAICEHKSAYPSVEAVQENTVKRNMLDMLGLVRREGEGDEQQQNNDNETEATSAGETAQQEDQQQDDSVGGAGDTGAGTGTEPTETEELEEGEAEPEAIAEEQEQEEPAEGGELEPEQEPAELSEPKSVPEEEQEQLEEMQE